VPATQSQGSSTPAPDKKPEAIHSLAYFDGKRLYGNSGGASPWIIDLRVKGNSIQVESLIVMVANRPFSLSCGGLFSGGLKVADDLSVRGECTGEQNNRQVSGKLPQLVISDVANSQYDGRWPGSTAPGASLLLIDDAQRSGFLAASKGQSLSTQEWANQDVRK